MSTLVSALMQRTVQTVEMDTTLAALESRFVSEGLAWMPVLDEAGTPLGVISAVDLIRARTQEQEPDSVQAWQLCSYRPVTVAPDTPAADAARLMTSRGIHHLVVMVGSRMVGVVSALDLLCVAFPAVAASRPGDR